MSKWRAKALQLFPDLRLEIQTSNTVGALWVELNSRLQSFYGNSVNDDDEHPPTLIRNICLYAVWCRDSESFKVGEAAGIDFYEQLPRFALGCKPPIYHRIIRDVVFSIGRAEVELAARTASAYMKPGDIEKFLEDVKQADISRQRKLRDK
jgi:hypothetical protein